MYKTITVFLVAFALLGLASTVTAQDNVGLSGQCYDAAAENGGEDEARVYTDGNVVLLPGTVDNTDPSNPTKGGAVPALVLFVSEGAMDGGQTGNACKRYDCQSQDQCDGRPVRYDYLEVSATIGAVDVQVCYNSAVETTGNCPRSPTGEGA